MPEPTTGAVIGAGSGAFAVGTITITGSFLGLQYEMLLAGLAGGLASSPACLQYLALGRS